MPSITSECQPRTKIGRQDHQKPPDPTHSPGSVPPPAPGAPRRFPWMPSVAQVDNLNGCCNVNGASWRPIRACTCRRMWRTRAVPSHTCTEDSPSFYEYPEPEEVQLRSDRKHTAWGPPYTKVRNTHIVLSAEMRPVLLSCLGYMTSVAA